MSIFLDVDTKLITAMESRWRGAKGEMGGEAGDEYALRCSCLKLRRLCVEGIMKTRSIALQSLIAYTETKNGANNGKCFEEEVEERILQGQDQKRKWRKWR